VSMLSDEATDLANFIILLKYIFVILSLRSDNIITDYFFRE